MFIVVLVFVGIDFITGVWASWARVKREQLTNKDAESWAFRSDKAGATVIKLLMSIVGVILAWLLDCFVLTFAELHLPQIVTGIVCGVEFWSFLENGADISPDTPLFRVLRKVMAKKVEEKTGLDVEETMKESKKQV
jgi:phage-related holin